jgi:hypothetical protein
MSKAGNNLKVSIHSEKCIFHRCYDFHGIFRLSIRSNFSKVNRYFQAEYGAFEAETCRPVDLDITVCNFSMESSQDIINFGKFQRVGGWGYAEEGYKIARWQFALQGLSTSPTQLFFKGGVFSLDFLQHFFIEQIIRYTICLNDFLLVHGGCVAKNDTSILFVGLGHTGKTSLALQKTLAGWQFQADDYTFLSAEGKTYSYPRRLHVSNHMFSLCPAAMQQLSPKNRFSIKLKKLIYYLTLRYGDLSEAVQLNELIPDAQTKNVAKLRTVILLTCSQGTQLQGPLPIKKDELIKRIMAINCVEGKPFFDILLCQQGHNKQALSLSEWLTKESDILRRALSGVELYEIIIPKNTNEPEAVLSRVAKSFEQLVE